MDIRAISLHRWDPFSKTGVGLCWIFRKMFHSAFQENWDGIFKGKPPEWEGESRRKSQISGGSGTFSTMKRARSASCCATCFISTASVNSFPNVRWVWGHKTGHSRDRDTGMGQKLGSLKEIPLGSLPSPSRSRSAQPALGAVTSWVGQGKLQKQSVQSPFWQKQSHLPAESSCLSLCSQQDPRESPRRDRERCRGLIITLNLERDKLNL